jgi:hypothetical protein
LWFVFSTERPRFFLSASDFFSAFGLSGRSAAAAGAGGRGNAPRPRSAVHLEAPRDFVRHLQWPLLYRFICRAEREDGRANARLRYACRSLPASAHVRTGGQAPGREDFGAAVDRRIRTMQTSSFAVMCSWSAFYCYSPQTLPCSCAAGALSPLCGRLVSEHQAAGGGGSGSRLRQLACNLVEQLCAGGQHVSQGRRVRRSCSAPFTFVAVFADVSMKYRLFSSAYACASCGGR